MISQTQILLCLGGDVNLPLYFHRSGNRLREGEETACGAMMTSWLTWDLNFCLLHFCLGHSEVGDSEPCLEEAHFFMCKMQGVGMPLV